MKKLLLSFLLVSMEMLAFSTVILIPQDYMSLNEAFAAASEGDTILVSPGTYQENFRIEQPKKLKIGSLYMTTGDTSYISRTIISGFSHGAALQIFPEVTSETEFMGFTLTQGTGVEGAGGAIHMENASALLHHLYIRNNSASQGGAISCTGEGSKLILYNSRIFNNTATNRGAAIHLFNAGLDINTCEISNNQVAGGLGGAISCYVGTGLSEMLQVYIESAFIINNESTDAGVTAGAYFEAPDDVPSMSINIQNSRFEGNTSTSSSALRIRGKIDFNIQNSLFLSNEASQFTGGVTFSNASNGNVVNSLFVSNKGATGGGSYNSGAVTVWSGSDVNFYNCSFIDNSASYGTAMTIGGAGASLTNCIFWGNGTDQISLLDINQTGGSLSVLHCDIEGGQASISAAAMSQLQWNEGNITADPLFQGSGDHPYSLTASSPCIDAGIPQTGDLPLPDADYAGRTRIWDGDGNGSSLIDIGPYEFGSPPVGIGSFDLNHESALRTSVYPNPSSSRVTVEFYLYHPQDVILAIYDNQGKLVHRMSGRQPAGIQRYNWNVNRRSRGIYHYIIQAGPMRTAGKIAIVH